jgi:uncharacterized protein (DUF488 family)
MPGEIDEILTVGHSTHPIDRFIELLGGAGVTVIADVRRYPGSRRNPQFGAQELASSLSAAGIGYESFAQSLGGRRARSATTDGPPAPDNSAWRNPSFRAYADYMAAPAFGEGLERLEGLAREARVAVMCAEAHPSRCHRQLIADALLARGRPVVHLLGDGRQVPHRLSSHAAIADGRVHYPAEPTQRLDIG